MAQEYSEGFKRQAVEKTLNRSSEITLVEMAGLLGVSRSTLSRWVNDLKPQSLTLDSTNNNTTSASMTTQEKRPQDWSLAEKLALIIQCDGLSDEAVSEQCRQQGVFPHHITEWKQAFITPQTVPAGQHQKTTVKQLRDEIKSKRPAPPSIIYIFLIT